VFNQHRYRGLVRSRLALLAAATAAGASLPVLGLAAVPAMAFATPSCTGFPTVTCTFIADAVDGGYRWPVPAGVTTVSVVADGASGADGTGDGLATGHGDGGKGGEFRATLSSIPAGTSLDIYPGETANEFAGGFNADGGSGGNGSADITPVTGPPFDTSGGGGGATTVAVSPFSVGSVLVAAGGGGGGSAENEDTADPGNGGNGGGSSSTSGTDAGPSGSPRGLGATSVAPGNGGANGGNGCIDGPDTGGPLSGGIGQQGVSCKYAGGGGGSGYFGGGGGGTGGGGGGGSAFPATAVTIDSVHVAPQSDTSLNSGNGSVSITYTVVVHRTRLRVWGHRSGHNLTLFAQLTGDGHPLPGASIRFGTINRTLCSGEITNSSGIATCALTSRQRALVAFWFGYIDASYAGTAGVPAAFAQGYAPGFGI
jgi:hypothetical protein